MLLVLQHKQTHYNITHLLNITMPASCRPSSCTIFHDFSMWAIASSLSGWDIVIPVAKIIIALGMCRANTSINITHVFTNVTTPYLFRIVNLVQSSRKFQVRCKILSQTVATTVSTPTSVTYQCSTRCSVVNKVRMRAYPAFYWQRLAKRYRC